MTSTPTLQTVLSTLERAHNAPRLEPFLPLASYLDRGFSVWRDRRAWMRTGLNIEQMVMQPLLKERFHFDFGYVLMPSELVEVLTQLLLSLGPTLEAGAGSGYLAAELGARGVDIFAVDLVDYRIPLEQRQEGYPMTTVFRRDALGDAVEHVSDKYSTVLLVWPPMNSFAYKVARAMAPGQTLVYEGEFGGCNADDDFCEFLSDTRCWEELNQHSDALNEVHVPFQAVNDRWRVWRRLAGAAS